MRPTRREFLWGLAGLGAGAGIGAAAASLVPPVVRKLFEPERIEGEDLVRLLNEEFPDGLAGQILRCIEEGRNFFYVQKHEIITAQTFGGVPTGFGQTYLLYEDLPVGDRYLGQFYVGLAAEEDGHINKASMRYIGLLPIPNEVVGSTKTLGVYEKFDYRPVHLQSEYNVHNGTWENTKADPIPLVVNNAKPSDFLEIPRKYNLS